MSEFKDFNASLEALGEAEVREGLAQGIWANKRRSWAEHWLYSREAERAAHHQEAEFALATEDSATGKEANEIAKASLEAARMSKNAAWVAAAAAIIAAVFAAMSYFNVPKP